MGIIWRYSEIEEAWRLTGLFSQPRLKEVSVMKVKTNLISGMLASILGIVLLVINPLQIQEEKFLTNGQIRADFIPKATSYVMILLGVILLVQSIVLKKEKIIEIEAKAFTRSLIFLGMLIVYAILFTYIGYLISSILFSVGLLLFLKCKKPLYYGICIVFPVLVYVVFTYGLSVKLPLL
jgi:hypothetical protein